MALHYKSNFVLFLRSSKDFQESSSSKQLTDFCVKTVLLKLQKENYAKFSITININISYGLECIQLLTYLRHSIELKQHTRKGTVH